VLQCVAVCCSVLQCVAVCCSVPYSILSFSHCRYLNPCDVCGCDHTATHSNTLQHNAAHCNTLQHTATCCNTLQHTATHCTLNNTQHTLFFVCFIGIFCKREVSFVKETYNLIDPTNTFFLSSSAHPLCSLSLPKIIRLFCKREYSLFYRALL